jgi:hypothetical protein
VQQLLDLLILEQRLQQVGLDASGGQGRGGDRGEVKELKQ